MWVVGFIKGMKLAEHSASSEFVLLRMQCSQLFQGLPCLLPYNEGLCLNWVCLECVHWAAKIRALWVAPLLGQRILDCMKRKLLAEHWHAQTHFHSALNWGHGYLLQVPAPSLQWWNLNWNCVCVGGLSPLSCFYQNILSQHQKWNHSSLFQFFCGL